MPFCNQILDDLFQKREFQVDRSVGILPIIQPVAVPIEDVLVDLIPEMGSSQIIVAEFLG